MNADPNIDNLDPGIRRTVALIRSWGFETTDSGDGVTKLAAGWPAHEAEREPHVYIKARWFELLSTTLALRQRLTYVGVPMSPIGHGAVYIQATYDPSDDSATVALYGLHDGLLPKEATA